MKNANYRKYTDQSHNSSTYHKKDGTPVRHLLKEEADQQITESLSSQEDNTTMTKINILDFKLTMAFDPNLVQLEAHERLNYVLRQINSIKCPTQVRRLLQEWAYERFKGE